MDLYQLLKSNGGIFEGHTEFLNGWHGNGWIEKGAIIKDPQLLYAVTQEQAKQIQEKFPNVDLVIGPEVSGVVVAGFVAYHLKKEFVITTGKGKNVIFHRMNVPDKSRKVVFVEDLIFTGTDVVDNLSMFKSYGIGVQAVSVWINRQSDNFNDIPVISLIQSPFQMFQKEDCLLCNNGEKIKYQGIRE